jgi:hypothetical protein
MLKDTMCGHHLTTGTRLRFPLGSLHREVCSLTNPIYPYDWEIVAFGGPTQPGMVLCRRLHERGRRRSQGGPVERRVAERTLAEYMDASRKGASRAAGQEDWRERARRMRLSRVWGAELAARATGWRERPCYYATVLRQRGSEDYRALAGPFATHEAALMQKSPAGLAAQRSGDRRAPWYLYGTALLPDGSTTPLFPELNAPPAAATLAA